MNIPDAGIHVHRENLNYFETLGAMDISIYEYEVVPHGHKAYKQ